MMTSQSKSQGPHPEELRRIGWLRSEREWAHELMTRIGDNTRHPSLIKEDKETLVIVRKYIPAIVDSIRTIRKVRASGMLSDDQISEFFGGGPVATSIRY